MHKCEALELVFDLSLNPVLQEKNRLRVYLSDNFMFFTVGSGGQKLPALSLDTVEATL